MRDSNPQPSLRKREALSIELMRCVKGQNWYTVLPLWSGLRDLNPRSPGPKPGAIPNFAKPGYSVEDFAVVVKYVVKEILPHFWRTFKSSYWGNLRRKRGVCNISGSRTDLVFQLPNQARYQTSLSPGICFYT